MRPSGGYRLVQSQRLNQSWQIEFPPFEYTIGITLFPLTAILLMNEFIIWYKKQAEAR